MAKKPEYKRGIKRGHITRNTNLTEDVVSRVSYEGNPVHKTYKTKWGNAANYADKAKCIHFDDPDGEELSKVLKVAIRARYFGPLRGEFPDRAWAWINDVLHEARLTNQESGVYHGYPLEDESHYPEPDNLLHGVPRVNITVL